MINKNRQTDSKPGKQSWIDVFARTQKLSRAFIVVLILHVVAVGGILAFEMFKPNENIASAIPLENEASKANDDVNEEIKERRFAGDLSGTGQFNKYIVQKGDSIKAIAESFKVSRTEILEVNLIDEGHPLVSGRILRIPKPKMSISGEDPVLDKPLDESGDFVSIEELTASANQEENNETVQGEDLSSPVNEDDGFQLLSKSDQKIEKEIIPRAIPVSAEPNVISAKVVREIPAEALIANAAVKNGNLDAQYIIESGDTLYGIAKKHRVSVDEILKLNPGVNPRALGIGRMLRMP